MKKNSNFIILIIFVLCISLVCMSNFEVDPDYLWHIKAGEYMFNNGILRHDVFSWSVNGRYWMSHEWLFEVFIYLLKIVFGKAHIFVFCLFSLLLLMSILFFTNLKNIQKNLRFSILWLVLFIISMFFVQVRPHMISFSFIALTIYFLFDLYHNENSKKIYFLPLVSIFWSNIHGGSSNLSYLFCIIFLISGLFKFNFKKIEAKRLNKKQMKKIIIVSILCMISICINIHGFKMFIYPYQNMLDKDMIMNILEWRSTSLNELSNYIYILFIVFITFIFLLSKKKINFIHFIFFGFCVFLVIKSVRFWFYTYIVMSYIVFDYVNEFNCEDDLKIIRVGMIIISILFFGIFIFNSKKLFTTNYSYFLKSEDIKYIKKLKPKKLFNIYDFGGDLIYNDIKVFIDGRADLYSKDLFNEYLYIANLDGDFYSYICKYDFDYFLVGDTIQIDYYLRYNNNYRLIYKNNNVKLYAKNNY